MKGRLLTLGLIVLAIVSGGIAVYFSNKYIQTTITQKTNEIDEQYEPIEVVVANFDLQPGDVISPHTVSLRKVPKGFIHSEAIKNQDFSGVNGFAISYRLGKGEILLRSHLSQRKGGKFAALVEKGRRAVTISVDNLSSSAGMLSPNDQVDLLLTTQKKDLLVTVPLLGRVRVIATGVETSENPSGEIIQYSTVTLDLDPEEAAKVTHARKVGEISFALRGSEEQGSPFDDAVSKKTLFNSKTVASVRVRPVEMIIGGQSNE